MSLIEHSKLSRVPTCCHSIQKVNCKISIKIAILLTLQFSCMVNSLTRPGRNSFVIPKNGEIQQQFHDKLNSVFPFQSLRDEANRMQRVLSTLSTSDHSPRDEDENSIDSLNHNMPVPRTESATMIRAQEDYGQITFEPEKSSIRKRDASITTTEEASSATLSTVDDAATTSTDEYQQQYLNSNQIESLSTTTPMSPSIEKYPYSESNYPEAQLVSITNKPPSSTAAFSPSQIDHFLHQQYPIPFCYELNGNIRYVSNKFATNRQPQGVWSSVHYYYDDDTIPYHYSYNYPNK